MDSNIILASLCSGAFSAAITIASIKRDMFWMAKSIEEHKTVTHSRIAKLESKVRDLELKVLGKSND
uniref:Uncharacterized protein n=7 Tax=Vibrionaceae TaxID=641 RepID=A0A0H4A1F0_9VIBR|nr:hypothetical protein [Vibrio splendidus]AKN36677.1 hypothetical protein [Vibrio sp. FF_482]AKN37851.1 hypothetical protein [Vibrio tasmaniensis]AKN38758.1 hypothetical protein [Enterovibrio norvegicus]AKN38942.1 hypothetical protein [Aliivibrio fischeri]AKN39147.1 hypothetical protein [Vibrio kanaloae]AKN39934.1 hypothetical protein [Vibrio sp. FF_307]